MLDEEVPDLPEERKYSGKKLRLPKGFILLINTSLAIK